MYSENPGNMKMKNTLFRKFPINRNKKNYFFGKSRSVQIIKIRSSGNPEDLKKYVFVLSENSGRL